MGRRKGSLNKKTIEQNKRLSARKQKEANAEQQKYPSLENEQVKYDVNDGVAVYQTKNAPSQQNAHTDNLPVKKNNYTQKKNDDRIEAILTGQGVIMPNAVDLEEAVLGAVMLEQDAYIKIAHLIPDAELFYDIKHQKVWDSINALAQKSDDIDILTVTNKLKEQGCLDAVGGPIFIAHLTSRVASAAHIEYHTHILIEKYIRRNIIKSSYENLAEAQEEGIDVFDLVENVQDRISRPIENILNIKSTDSFPMFLRYMEHLQTVFNHDGKLLGVTSGVPDLDHITNGWRSPRLIIIAARPGMGKTAALLTLARNAIGIQRKKVGILSMEMDEEELIGRLYSMDTGYSAGQLESGKGIPHSIWKHLQQIPEIYRDHLSIDDTGGLTLEKLKIRIKQMVHKKKLDIVFIDYLQLINHTVRKNGNKDEEVGAITKGLKALSKQLKIPIILLSQLNRKLEDRGDKRPQLADLRESGNIEQDADMVIFLFRPEYYRKLGSEAFTTMTLKDGREIDSEGMAIWDIAKNRHGPKDEIVLNFKGEIMMFYQDGFKHDFVAKPTDEPQHVKNDENIEKVPDRYIKGDIFKSLNQNNNKDRPTPKGNEGAPF